MDLNVKLFADGADKAGMLEMYANPLISGFTTNPTLMKVACVSDYKLFAKDLNLSDSLVVEHLMFAGEKPGETITTAMPKEGAAKWFGVTPPDLSLVARAKGTDWIYSYLRGFYEDESKVFGVNNKVLESASMPDVLWSLKEGKSEAEFDQDVRDITNFLDYVGEPAKLIRTSLGVWVLLFLSVLLVLTYLLKKEYWKDVKYGIWRPRD